ncbi:MAG: peptidoglycan bridge formation glycyltransferase FemA/FemB family protein [Thermodesulfobacteriota bacterium]|jgi:hypothetical protein
MDIQIINPITYPGWDDLVVSHPDYSFFHSSAWARVLFESYHYTPKYFTIINDGKLLALIPVMEVNSFLTGKRGVSLPFTDYCKPIIANGISFQNLLEHIIENGKKCGWKSLELRSSSDLLPSTMPSITYLGHTLGLDNGEQEVFSNFRDSTKRNAQKAVKEGVEVKIDHSLESLKEFYRLNCMTRREHGLPPQPFHFFKKIYDHVISRNLGFVILASYSGKNIAGAVYFHFGEKAVYKYGASDKKFQHLRANNLVMWEAIQWYSQNGYKNLCFGRTERENQGLIQFKSGWGTTEQQINYYRYDLNKGSFVPGSSKVTGFHNKIFRNLPLPLLKRVGSVLYKHVG